MAVSSSDEVHKRTLLLRRKWSTWSALITFAGMMLLVNFLSVNDSVPFSELTTASGVVQGVGRVSKSMNAMNFLQQGGMIHHLVQGEDGEDVSLPHLPPPHEWPPLEEGTEEQCFYVRDYGLLERLNNSGQSFCAGDEDNSSPYTFYSVPESGLQATKLDNLVIDWRGAHVSHDITSLAQDGMGHDPRFKYKNNATYCSCEEPQDPAHGAPDIWKYLVDGGPGKNDAVCQPPPSELPGDVLTVQRAVLLSRKDDHNPFFQIASIMNAWIMMNVLGWSRTTTQLVTFDRAWPSPVDELRHAVLGPERRIITGEEIQKRVVHFNSVLLAPYEARGTLINHLDDTQPCYANAMVADFRDLALKSLGVTPRGEKTDPRRCLVTIISRRPYGGRTVQRVWQNESDVVDRMRQDYSNVFKSGGCDFQSLDFVNLTMHDQMRVMVDSDVVIGMHGAGMVNVMWTRPGTLVVEIFPKQKHRGGYRNICQFLGCSWHEFRGGQDIVVRSQDPNDMDKVIPYDEWAHFFHPLFMNIVERLQKTE